MNCARWGRRPRCGSVGPRRAHGHFEDEDGDPHKPFYNTYAEGHPYNMGGCMGCHGVAQRNGGGFSFMFDGISKGLSNHPDAAVGPGKNGGFGYAAAARWAAPANHEEPRP